MPDPQKIVIYTDGSAIGNPGPGGYGIVLKFGEHRKELSAGYRLTTNNRMELLAVVEALKALKTNKLPVVIYSDSQYVINAVEKGWVFNWAKKGFKNKKNPDLWRLFLNFYPHFKVEFRWVKGHAGIPENERCDVLAKEAADDPTLVDANYERENQSLI